MEETISIKDLFYTIKKRLSLIVVITALAVMVSGIISYFFLTPVYQVSTQILVNQSKDENTAYNYSEVQTNLQLINTYNVIIKSPAILDLVNEELELGITTSELNEKITVSNEQNSQVVNIAVQDENPYTAVDIANTVAEIFQQEVSTIMNVDNVTVLAKAVAGENPSPIKPQPLLNIAISLVIGLMLGVGLAFLLEYLDNTIKTEQDVERILGLAVLGAITTIDNQAALDPRAKRTAARRRG